MSALFFARVQPLSGKKLGPSAAALVSFSRKGKFSFRLAQDDEIKRELLDSPPRNRGHDADFITLLHWRFLVLEKADVLAVDVDVDEAAHVALRVEEAFADAGVLLVERGEEFAEGCALDLDGVEIVGQGPERGGDGDGYGHKFTT